jgi:hypothetical protein
MVEGEKHRVKSLPPELLADAAKHGIANRLPVERITEHRVSMIGEVNANLVGAPSFESATDERTSMQKLDSL